MVEGIILPPEGKLDDETFTSNYKDKNYSIN